MDQDGLGRPKEVPGAEIGTDAAGGVGLARPREAPGAEVGTDAAFRVASFAEHRVDGERVTLLKDGAQAYPAMLAAIAQARHTVCLETYILASDATGRRFAAALEERARAGVEVSVLYDAWGSSVSDAYLAGLSAAGVRLCAFRPFRLNGTLGRALTRFRRRNHRKLLVVDGEVAFAGGLNISDDYAAAEDGGRNWRDTQVRIEGPTALRLQAIFLKTWRRSRGAKPTPWRYAPPPIRRPGAVWVVPSGFSGSGYRIRKLYLRAIRAAHVRITLTNAYFVPTRRLLKALIAAAKRGVDVRLIVAGESDVPTVRLASRHLYERLMKAGARIWEYQGRVLHAKTAVVDGELAMVGSCNLDTQSLSVNLELNVALLDGEVAASLERMAEEDLAASHPMQLVGWNERPLFERFLSWAAYQLRSWL